MLEADTLKQMCISEQSSILDVVLCLNQSRRGIVFLCNSGGKLLGTITDADIRRGLASNIGLDQPASKVATSNAIITTSQTSNDEILELFERTKVRAIPVVDHEGIIISCIFYDQIIGKKVIKKTMLVMAGGFGRRMGELTSSTPKPMLEVQGKPILELIIDRAIAEGFKKIFISTHYLAHKISDYFGDGANLGVELNYIYEEKPLGTGGSFGKLPDLDGPIVVTNGDLLSNINYSKLLDFHVLNEAIATVAVQKHFIEHPYGVVESDGITFSGMKEKPIWVTNVNAGIYVLDCSVKQMMFEGEAISMPELIQRVSLESKRVIIFPIHEQWQDIGNAQEYSNLIQH